MVDHCRRVAAEGLAVTPSLELFDHDVPVTNTDIFHNVSVCIDQ